MKQIVPASNRNNKEVLFMARIRCSVTSCFYQDSDHCDLNNIKVTESATGDPLETDCASYKSKDAFVTD